MLDKNKRLKAVIKNLPLQVVSLKSHIVMVISTDARIMVQPEYGDNLYFLNYTFFMDIDKPAQLCEKWDLLLLLDCVKFVSNHSCVRIYLLRI